MTQQFYSLGYTQDKWKHLYTEICTQIFIEPLFITGTVGNNINAHQMINKTCIHIKEYYLAIKKKKYSENMSVGGVDKQNVVCT